MSIAGEVAGPRPRWLNPLIPGFNPDPSIVQAEGVYYLVTSTFEYLPGIPVYRSLDLRTWEHIGNVITRPEQATLDDVPTPGGVWAPTIRHRDGVFYVIVTVMLSPRGCVVFTAADPAGPWSDGVPLPAVHGIDPDLAWDDDGTACVTYAFLDQGIFQVRVDLESGMAVEEPRLLTTGSGLYAPEGPHLYQRAGTWYLVVAEGGTDRGHAVSVARSTSPNGPFDWHPTGPVLSARSTGSQVQNLGHADLVDTLDGETVLVLLGVRPVGLAQAFSPLGRETFMTDVEWVDGWPQPAAVELEPGPGGAHLSADFDDPHALDDPGWVAVRALPSSIAAVLDGRLRFEADVRLGDRRPHFVGRRQQHLTAVVSTSVDASHGVGGLAVRLSDDHWFAVEADGTGSDVTITARARLSALEQNWTVRLPAGDVQLRIEMTPPSSDFSAGAVGGDRVRLSAAPSAVPVEEVVLAELDGRYWTFEVAKCFTGRVVGMFATSGHVAFADFHYEGSNR